MNTKFYIAQLFKARAFVVNIAVVRDCWVAAARQHASCVVFEILNAWNARDIYYGDAQSWAIVFKRLGVIEYDK